MNVLVIGSGGREHAIVWSVAQDAGIGKIIAVPGNAGIAQLAECRAIPVAPPFTDLADLAERENVTLTLVGPEAPLVDGLVDVFEERGLPVFGPNRHAAWLEGSKAFAKRIMARYGIPTGQSRTFDRAEDAARHIRQRGGPIVVKADGLAAGKGVVVCAAPDEAVRAVEMMMVARKFGDSGARVVVEECLFGEEASFTVLCDGFTALPLASSQDHKRAYDGDEGPNTGGMGAYSPAPVVDKAMHERILREIVHPLLAGMADDGHPYRGVLYVGVMVTDSGPKALEFNCRLGDPEAQAILPRISAGFVEAVRAAAQGRLADVSLTWRPDAAACVVMASGWYPRSSRLDAPAEDYPRGVPIAGLDAAARRSDTFVFHAGTAFRDGRVVTNGGRVLGVTALGPDIRSAVARAYEAVEDIHFEDAHCRRDIGYRALARLNP